jgi:enamine deaminase RidA (YjgF/YER057c/UK114 family)
LIAPAPLDAEGRIADHGNMGRQMAQSYANAKKLLARYGATMNDVVEEILYVAGKVRAEA